MKPTAAQFAALIKKIKLLQAKHDDDRGVTRTAYVIVNADGTVPKIEHAGLLFHIIGVPSGKFVPKASDDVFSSGLEARPVVYGFWRHIRLEAGRSYRAWVEGNQTSNLIGNPFEELTPDMPFVATEVFVPAPEAPATNRQNVVLSADGESLEAVDVAPPVVHPPQPSLEQLAELKAALDARAAEKAADVKKREAENAALFAAAMPQAVLLNQPQEAVRLGRPAPIGAQPLTIDHAAKPDLSQFLN